MGKIASTDCTPNDLKLVQIIRNEMSKKNNVDSVANFLKIISDPTRMRIIMILEKNEISVNDISVLMDMTKSAISHQLKVLKDAGYIKNKYYSLFDEHIMDILNAAYNHVNHC
tara:strand:+ start:310 stop:648 length:339 start_codon:yes stop_codon:yes gene_type:complete